MFGVKSACCLAFFLVAVFRLHMWHHMLRLVDVADSATISFSRYMS